MKINLILTGLFLQVLLLNAQVGINTTSPDNNSILDIVSTDKGVLIPRLQLDDLNTNAPLSNSINDGMLIYSEQGIQPDGFYYWEANKWRPIGRTPKKTFTVATSGGYTGIPHLIPSDTDKFETYNGNWASLFEMPSVVESLNADRLNEFITVQKGSTYNVNISTTNTDMLSNLTLSGTQSAVFIFDGTKWIHVKTSN